MARIASRSRTRTPAAGVGRWTPQGPPPAVTDLVDRRHGLPWLTAAAVFGAACAAHLLWRDSGTVVWVAVALTLGTCALTQLAWHHSAKRRLPVRVNIAGNVFAAFGWLTVATITGPWTRPTVDVFLIGGGFLALTWNLRQASSAGEGEDDGDVLGRLFNRNAGVVGLAGAKARTTELTGVGAKLQVQLPAGEVTQRDVVAKQELIASLLGTAPNGVRITPDAGNSRAVEVAVQAVDVLKDPTPWPGPVSARKSIADAPILTGVYEDGLPVELKLYQPDGMRHLLIQGMNGSGKSVFARNVLADLFTRSDVVVWAIDVVKGRQTLGWAEPGLDWFATTTTQAAAMFDALLKAIPARGNYLAGLPEPLDNWQPGCGIPALVVLIEEAPTVINNGKRFVDAAQQARSVGIVLLTSVQRASWSSMPTDARAQFANAICFGVQDVDDASFVIEDLVDRGADPSQWKNEKPGYAYLSAGGIAKDRQVMPLRTYAIEREELDAVAGYRAANPVALDEDTAAAAGKQYQARRLSVVPVPSEQEDTIDEDDMTVKRPADHEPDIEASLDPLPGDDVDTVVTFTLPEPKTSTADARAHLRRTIAHWAAAGREFSPSDFYDAAAEVGRGDDWVRKEFAKLQDGGLIRRLDWGVYRALEAALA